MSGVLGGDRITTWGAGKSGTLFFGPSINPGRQNGWRREGQCSFCLKMFAFENPESQCWSGICRNCTSTMVYIIKSENGWYKIGHAGNPRGRFNNIQANSPIKLDMIAVVPGGKFIEHKLHNLFSYSRRKHSEWFKSCPEIETYIRALPDKYTDKTYKNLFKILGEL